MPGLSGSEQHRQGGAGDPGPRLHLWGPILGPTLATRTPDRALAGLNLKACLESSGFGRAKGQSTVLGLLLGHGTATQCPRAALEAR